MKGINKLQAKWGVGSIQFWLIILTFALGGSLSGRLCSFLLKLVFLEKNWVFWLVYPLFLTILWPFSVLFVSFFTGQFSFFKGYLSRVGGKLLGRVALDATTADSLEAYSEKTATTPKTTTDTYADSFSNNTPIHVAIFASGAGSNAKKIIEYFASSTHIKITLIVCNVPTAGVLNIAKEKGIPTLLINKTEFSNTGYVESLRNADIHFIVLAGFLWKVPAVLVRAFEPVPNNLKTNTNNTKGIINIHPALLPKYGGKGMYGSHVHDAVIAAGEKESGITIHWVNENYDEGDIIFQAKCSIDTNDTAETLANKIHALEHAHFAPTIEGLLK
jgi:folate-dependent phosphoribosylglycinamide formyltransferase PurN